MNVVTGRGGGGEAVLIRALEPTEGIPVMQKRRGINDLRLLCSGPGRLTQAIAITGKYNGLPLDYGPLRSRLRIVCPVQGTPWAAGDNPDDPGRALQSERICYRFYLKGNPYVSRGIKRVRRLS